MTIDEAIKILRQDIDDPGSVAIEDVNTAEELGIEALKLFSGIEPWHLIARPLSLPGETKE